MEINIEKKHFYGILGLIILITSGIIIYANVDTSKPWHDASSIQVTINGQQMSLQEALENDLFTAQSEGGASTPSQIAPGTFKGGGDYIFPSDSQVSIGTTNPSPNAKLDVNGNIVTSKIGIGVTNPSAELDVKGDIKASLLVDRENPQYFINPASYSKLNRLQIFYSPQTSNDVATKSYVDSIANCPDGFKQYYDPNGNKFCMRPNTDTIHGAINQPNYNNAGISYNFYARIVDGKPQIRGVFFGSNSFYCMISNNKGFISARGTDCNINNAQWFTFKTNKIMFSSTMNNYLDWEIVLEHNKGVRIKATSPNNRPLSNLYKWTLDGKNVNLYPTQDVRFVYP